MGIKARKNVVYLCGLILLLVNVCRAVKINSIKVPPRFELRDDAEALILDCDFTVNSSDTGFVLKWLHNGVAIYQWIPSKKVPFALGAFKGRVDTNYTASEDRFKKHSALVISKPLLSDSGNYTCNVQTFQGSDKQSAEMQIIDPEDKIDLTYTIDDLDDSVDVRCSITNIFPLPVVKLLFENEERDIETVVENTMQDEVYDVIVTAKLKKSEIKDESPVACELSIPNSDYTKRETITYDDPKQSATTKKTILGELTKSARSEYGATNESIGNGLRISFGLMIVSALLLLSSPNH